MENRLSVGISHGDVNGISYELIIKLLAENRMCELCVPILYGSPKVAAYYRKALNAETFALNPIKEPSEANGKRSNIINCADDEVKVELGKETDESDRAAMAALKRALDHADGGHIDVVVAAPQGKGSFLADGAADLTDFLRKRYGAADAMTLAVNEKVRIGFVTEGGRLRDVPGQVTARGVLRKLTLLANTLRDDFTIQKPKIAVLALNSRVRGEQSEEAVVIGPAIERARQSGIMALGPFAAEEFFAKRMYEKFDAVLAMYRDQGMVPFSAMNVPGNAVYVAGLPVVCAASLDDPRYDSVGQNQADEQGLRNALYLAMDVRANRARNKELKRNPLPHYDIASNGNEGDLNVEQIEGVKEEPED